MVKRKNPKTKKRALARVSRPVRMNMDVLAQRYTALLLNPCTAELVHPTYGGTDGAYLMRFTRTLTFGAGSAFAFQWTPGCIGTAAGGTATDTSLLVREATAFATVGPVVASDGDTVAGGSYLRNAAGAARCVAGCAQVFYTGAESARAGLLYFGHTTGSTMGELYTGGGSVSPATVASSCPHAMKTPGSLLEIIWKPCLADDLWTETDLPSGAHELSRKGAIVLCGQALPSAVTVKFTAVYEYTPDVNQSNGIVFPTAAVTSRSTLRDVLTADRKSVV